MKGKIVIEEDTFSEYLEFVHKSLHENMDKELRHLARTMVGEEWDEHSGFIPKYMTIAQREYNPNLFASGQEEEYWQLKTSKRSGVIGGGTVSSIETVYTGMRLEDNVADKPKVWSEFGDKAAGVLERDYAFFQETGIDPIADSDDARAKGGINKGIMASSETLFNHSAEYVYNIMRRGKGDIPPKLI